MANKTLSVHFRETALAVLRPGDPLKQRINSVAERYLDLMADGRKSALSKVDSALLRAAAKRWDRTTPRTVKEDLIELERVLPATSAFPLLERVALIDWIEALADEAALADGRAPVVPDETRRNYRKVKRPVPPPTGES